MMYSPETEQAFLLLLETARAYLLENSGATPGPTEFENQVCDALKRAAVGTVFADTIVLTGAASFPDIVVGGCFGVEVKMTTSDKWVSLGNSVMEGTRIPGVEKIYIFFGKFGGAADFRYRSYDACLYDIGVTHSPRYKINMELQEGRSIFDVMGLTYDELRSSDNMIGKIRAYYRSQLKEGEELWWLEGTGEEVATVPVIKQFSRRTPEERERFLIETMALFPEIFGKSQVKYERVAAFLAVTYGEVSSSLRDVYSAGGRVVIEVAGAELEVSQLIGKLQTYALKIKEIIETASVDDLQHYWEVEAVSDDRLAQWLGLIDAAGTLEDGTSLSGIFCSGLGN